MKGAGWSCWTWVVLVLDSGQLKNQRKSNRIERDVFSSCSCTVKLRYNNLRYNNIPRYNNIFSADQKLYLLINVIRYNNMIRYNNV